jgi:hypothetical protein
VTEPERFTPAEPAVAREQPPAPPARVTPRPERRPVVFIDDSDDLDVPDFLK